MTIQVHPNVKAMFAASVVSVVGNGANTLFWTDRWLFGKSIQDLAPALSAVVPRRFINKRTVQEAFHNRQWVEDVRRGGSVAGQALPEFLLLWDILQEIHITPGVEDHHIWTPAITDVYSTTMAYSRFFLGSTAFEPAKRIWKTWAHLGASSSSGLRP